MGVPSFDFIELLQYSAAYCLTAHIHCNESRCEVRTIFVAIDFLEDKAKHGGADKCFVFLLNCFQTLTTEIVSIQKFKKVCERFEVARALFTFGIFKNSAGIERECASLQTTYEQHILLEFSRLKKARV